MGIFRSSTPAAPPDPAVAALAALQRQLAAAEADMDDVDRELAKVKRTAGATVAEDEQLALRELGLTRAIARKNAAVVALRHKVVAATPPIPGPFDPSPLRIVDPLAGVPGLNRTIQRGPS